MTIEPAALVGGEQRHSTHSGGAAREGDQAKFDPPLVKADVTHTTPPTTHQRAVLTVSTFTGWGIGYGESGGVFEATAHRRAVVRGSKR